MISVKRLAEPSGKQFYSVESRLPDGKLQCITRSHKFKCNTRGFEDGDARGKALRFVITTDTLPQFRAFIFSDMDAVAGPGRSEGSVSHARLDSSSPLGSSQESWKRRIRSYVCIRQNRLTGLRFVVAMSRLENGRLRAVSFQDHSLVGAGSSDEALNKAIRFLRGVAFESWRKQAMSELMTRDREAVAHRRERALKHVSAFVEIEAGEKVDCTCGKNRSRGLMVACERCGAWEHAECQGFRSNKQGECGDLKLEDLWTDAKTRGKETDIVCCVCGCEDNHDFENMINPVNEHACDGGAALAHPSCISAAQHLVHQAWHGKALAAGMCQLCGDRFGKSPKGSEEIHSLNSSGVTHTKIPKESTSPSQSQGRQSRRAVKVDHSVRGAKRLRSALTNGAVAAKPDVMEKCPAKNVKEDDIDATQGAEKNHTLTEVSTEEKINHTLTEVSTEEKMNHTSTDVSTEQTKKMGETILGRRFSDAAVTVPIKKRRLQMMEVVRSPSPPPRSPSPPPSQVEVPSPRRRLIDQVDMKENDVKENIELRVGTEDAEMVEAGVEAAPVSTSEGNNDDAIEERKEGIVESKDAGASSSASQGRSRDVRLHWDLNMDMENWGSPPEEDTGTFSGVGLGLASNVSQVTDINGDVSEEEGEVRAPEMEEARPEKSDEKLQSTDYRPVGSPREWNEDHAEDVEAENVDYDDSDFEAGDKGLVDVAPNVSQNDDVNGDASDDEVAHAHETEEALPEKSDDKLQSTDSRVGGSSREWNEEPADEIEAEHVDYDASDSRDGEEAGSEAGEKVESERRDVRLSVLEEGGGVQECDNSVQVKCLPVDEGTREDECLIKANGVLEKDVVVEENVLQSGESGSPVVEHKSPAAEEVDLERRGSPEALELHSHDKGNTQGEVAESHLSEKAEGADKMDDDKQMQEEKEASTAGSSARRADGQARAKSSGWDQLPEGFDKAEDALRAAKENPVVRSGRGSPWGTTNGRGASISPRGGPVTSRFGRGLRTDSLGDRTRSDDSWNREDHQRVQRVDESVDISPRLASPRELGRGRSHGRGGSPVVRGRGRMEPWMDSPGGPTSPWGPNRHPSPPGRYGDGGFGPRGPTNAAAMAAAKVESSGFVVAPDGTVTKAGSSSRGPPRPFQGGGRNGRGSMFNMGRGGPGMNMGVGLGLGGMRMGIGRGMGIGPGLGMNMGMGIGMGVGPGLGLSNHPGRGGPGGRGMADRYSGPYSGRCSTGSPVVESSSSSRRQRSNDDYSESWSRREDLSSSPRKRRSASRRSRSRTPSKSKSRTRSPRARTPPRPANSSGSGGGDLGRSSKKRSASPTAPKHDLRVEKVESPVLRSLPPPPKLPLPPPPPRSQRSPPAALKRPNDSRKDGDRSRDRERERERERPSTRVRTPPRRTSPHVVHGSALMDERDRQLLAGIRHVSPVGARNRSSEVPASGVPASSKRSPPLASPVGRVADGTSEPKRQSGDEGMDSRIQVPKREDTGSRVETRSSKETAKVDRERISRRDSGRDRDEERREMSKSSYSSRDRDGRSSSSLKYNREGDDDVAPRRRRPSP